MEENLKPSERIEVTPTGMNVPELVLLTDMPKYFSWLKLTTLRNLVAYSFENGFNTCIRRLSPTGKKQGRILIHVPTFLKWLDTHFEQGV